MARMIDASRFGEILEQWKKDCLEDNDIQGADIILDVILQLDDMPTLTQPNEPLTLDELGEMSYTDWVWLEFPREKPSDNCWERGWKAYRLYSHERYGVSWIAYRRPPEGEEEEKHVIEITENL